MLFFNGKEEPFSFMFLVGVAVSGVAGAKDILIDSRTETILAGDLATVEFRVGAGFLKVSGEVEGGQG